MQVIPITIPRVFYVNCLEDKGPEASTMGRRVARTLPNGRPSPFLHEVAMDEAKFQRNEKRASRKLWSRLAFVLATALNFFVCMYSWRNVYCSFPGGRPRHSCWTSFLSLSSCARL